MGIRLHKRKKKITGLWQEGKKLRHKVDTVGTEIKFRT